MPDFKTIAFDADDTLWVNEPIFTNTRIEFEKILGKYIQIDENLEKELYEVESRNLKLFGYGIKGFMLSMIESALELTHYNIKGEDVERIITLGKEMLKHPVEVLLDVKKVLDMLENNYELIIITKGDLWDQENKIARSGLANYFKAVEILSEKDAHTYAEAFHRNDIHIQDVIMVGNSLKSDILPICELGGTAVHIPFHDTWMHEHMEKQHTEEYDYFELSKMNQLPGLLEKLSQD